MISGVVTVVATYLSLRLYEYYKETKYPSPHIPTTNHAARVVDTKAHTPAPRDMLIDTNENKVNKHYVKMSGLSIGISTARYFYPPLTLISILAFTYTAIPYLKQTEKSLLKEKKVDGYVLYSIADMMMLGLGAYASASVGIGLLHLSKYILSNTKEKSKKQLVDIFSQQPDKVWIIKNGVEVQIPIDQVKENDTLIISAGDIVPVDGVVTEGIAAVDQKLLTGEPQPADKAVGDRVFASTMIVSGRINIHMEKSGKETIVAKIGEIINRSIEFKGSQELKGEKWADSFTVPVLALGFISWPFLGPMSVVAILYCHIANSIRVVAPLGTLNYLNIAVQNGILVKDGHVLEEMVNIDTIIFDKTGTLTQETPIVGDVILCDTQYSEEEILFYAAAAEQKSVHPIAKAILKKAEDRMLILPKIDDSSYEIGYGISVDIKDKRIHIGSHRFMKMKDIDIPNTIQERMDKALAIGHSVILVAINSKLQGILEIQTIVRPEAKNTVRTLRQSGIKYMAIVSGNQEQPTKALASFLEMDDCFYETLPQEKANIVEQLQKKGRKVAFIGDGVNDTIAMEKADISISLNGASTIATDVAQVILMDGGLMHIPYLLELSKKLDKNLSRSLILNIIPNVIALNGVLFFRFGLLTTMLVSQSPLVLGAINAWFPVSGKVNDLLDNDSEDSYRTNRNEN